MTPERVEDSGAKIIRTVDRQRDKQDSWEETDDNEEMPGSRLRTCIGTLNTQIQAPIPKI